MRPLLTALALLTTMTPARGQQEAPDDVMAQRIAAARSTLERFNLLIAGVVRDSATGRPIVGADVGDNEWSESRFGLRRFLAPHGAVADRLRTDEAGRFAGVIDSASVAGLPAYRPIEVLVRADGYLPVLVVSRCQQWGSEAGHGLDVEMERCLSVRMLVVDECGGVAAATQVGWLLLRDGTPCLEGRAMTDGEGHLEIEPSCFATPRGLMLHLWTATRSARIALDELAEPTARAVHGTAVLRLTPAPKSIGVVTPPRNLREVDIGLPEDGCVQYANYAAKFEITLVSRSPAPGSPVRVAWSGEPTTLSASIVGGPVLAIAHLDRTSHDFAAFDGGRGRLDVGPQFGRADFEVDGSSSPHIIPASHRATHEVRDDVVRVTSPSPRETGVSALPLPAPTPDAPAETAVIAVPAVVGIQGVYAQLLVDGVADGYPQKLTSGELRVPRSRVRDGVRAVLSWWDLTWKEPREIPAVFARGPVLMDLLPTDHPLRFGSRPARRVDRMTVRVVDENGVPAGGVLVWFRGSLDSRRSAWDPIPVGEAPWGFAYDARSGLPRVTMRTDSDGQLRLRDFPTGTWHVALLRDAKSVGEHVVAIADDTSVIGLVAPR